MREVRLDDATALRAYAHPLRLKLIGLLRAEGAMTATQAAARLGDTVPNCSFHLRQLAKYGLAERAPGADARERPWRATARYTAWESDSDDPAVRAAADQLETAILGEYTQRVREYLAKRADEPAEWRRAAGLGDILAHVTAAELEQLMADVGALLARFDDRLEDPSRRPRGARTVQIMRMAVPRD
jgi:predicted ArsR family transcriptional regulator